MSDAPPEAKRKGTSGSLRIGMFSESFDPVLNGVTISVLTLVNCLRSRQHHVFIFAPSHQQQPAHESNVLRFPSFVSIFNRDYPLAYPFLPRLTLETHFDDLKLQIVHTHTPFILGLTGAKLAIGHGIPLVSTYHTLYTQYSHYVPLLPESVTQTLIEHYLPWYYNRCAQIICPSRVAECALRKLGVDRPITIIPTGIPLPPRDKIQGSVRRTVRAKLDISPETPLMLYTGRLAPEKNIAWLLEAYALVRKRVPTARLALVGDGSMTETLRARCQEMGLGDGVLFPGSVPRSELDSLYAAADVFCFPSLSETQGLVVGEARAAGLPSVVVDSGGAPETVSDGEDGYLIRVDDGAAFAERVTAILTDRSLSARLRAQARANARKFTPENMTKQVLSVYALALTDLPAPVALDLASPADQIDWEGGVETLQHDSYP